MQAEFCCSDFEHLENQLLNSNCMKFHLFDSYIGPQRSDTPLIVDVKKLFQIKKNEQSFSFKINKNPGLFVFIFK